MFPLSRHLLVSNPQPHSPSANCLTFGDLSTHSGTLALIPLDGDTTRHENEYTGKEKILLSMKYALWAYNSIILDKEISHTIPSL